MTKRFTLSLLLLVSPLFANQTAIGQLADHLQVEYSLLDAMNPTCPGEVKNCYLSELTLSYPTATNYSDFSIFFSQLMPIYSVESENFSITHINGDLHKITPKEGFKGFQKEAPETIRFFYKRFANYALRVYAQLHCDQQRCDKKYQCKSHKKYANHAG